MAVSSGYYSYNGHVLPDITEVAYFNMLTGDNIIYIKDGFYHYFQIASSAWNMVTKVKDKNALYPRYASNVHYILQDNAWVAVENLAKEEEIPFDVVVWTKQTIEINVSTDYMVASPAPEPVYSDGTLIGVPDSVSISSEGETGIIISAVVKLDDSELDVSISAKFEIIPSGSGYLDESRQLFVNAGYSNLSVQITLDALPGQVATIPVRVISTGYPTKMTPYLGLAAYFLGRRIAGQRRKPPVAWLYNGIPLPVEPVYDKKLYSYALITRNDDNSYDFVVMAQPCYFNNNEGEVHILMLDDTSTAGQTYEATVESPDKFALSANNPYFGFSYDYVVWTNFDLYNSTGELHTAASEPVPCYFVPEEKLATYNGIEAPVLSGYDSETYPYAVMVQDDGGVRVFISTTPILFNYYFTSSKSGMRLYCKNNGTIARVIKGCWDNRWEYYKETEESGDAGTSFFNSFSKLVWANHDIYFATDETNLYLAASEPIPVYE